MFEMEHITFLPPWWGSKGFNWLVLECWQLDVLSITDYGIKKFRMNGIHSCYNFSLLSCFLPYVSQNTIYLAITVPNYSYFTCFPTDLYDIISSASIHVSYYLYSTLHRFYLQSLLIFSFQDCIYNFILQYLVWDASASSTLIFQHTEYKTCNKSRSFSSHVRFLHFESLHEFYTCNHNAVCPSHLTSPSTLVCTKYLFSCFFTFFRLFCNFWTIWTLQFVTLEILPCFSLITLQKSINRLHFYSSSNHWNGYLLSVNAFILSELNASMILPLHGRDERWTPQLFMWIFTKHNSLINNQNSTEFLKSYFFLKELFVVDQVPVWFVLQTNTYLYGCTILKLL